MYFPLAPFFSSMNIFDAVALNLHTPAVELGKDFILCSSLPRYHPASAGRNRDETVIPGDFFGVKLAGAG